MTAPTEHDREALVRRLRNKLFDNPDFRNPGNPSYRKGYVDGLNDMTDEFKAALTAQGGEQTADTVSVSASSWAKLREVFARRFPRCRDCADEAGVCPHSGLPCEFDSMLLPTAAADTVPVPRELIDRFPELNPSNYNEDDVAALNAWGIEVFAAAKEEK